MNLSRFIRLKHAALLLSILLGALSSSAGITPVESLFTQGNQAFLAGDYDEAIRQYRAVKDRGGVSPSLLYNLAHAYREGGQRGHAVLNYERALWLAPGNPDVQASLDSIRNDTALVLDPEPNWVAPFRRLSLTQWSWLAAGSWCSLGLLALVRGLGFKRVLIGRMMIVSLVALVVCAGGVASQLERTDRAVVIRDDAPLLVSPYEAASHVASIREGKLLRVVDAHGEFLKVESAAGQTGWMASRDVSRIVPAMTETASR